jgi:hypothetical protein
VAPQEGRRGECHNSVRKNIIFFCPVKYKMPFLSTFGEVVVGGAPQHRGFRGRKAAPRP